MPKWEAAMPAEPRVQELLDELLDRQTTPEEVCGACPELLPVVRGRWRQICRARAELDALLPIRPHGSLPTTTPPEELPLPQVPGYEVESVLGRGGMGVVYRARHLRLGRLVALKMALAGSYAGPHERERFRREAEAVAAPTPEPRTGLRRRRLGRPALLHHGVDRGGQPGPEASEHATAGAP